MLIRYQNYSRSLHLQMFESTSLGLIAAQKISQNILTLHDPHTT